MVMTMVQIFEPASFLKLTDRSCLTGLEALISNQCKDESLNFQIACLYTADRL